MKTCKHCGIELVNGACINLCWLMAGEPNPYPLKPIKTEPKRKWKLEFFADETTGIWVNKAFELTDEEAEAISEAVREVLELIHLEQPKLILGDFPPLRLFTLIEEAHKLLNQSRSKE